jgi:hypothetical protein
VSMFQKPNVNTLAERLQWALQKNESAAIPA